MRTELTRWVGLLLLAVKRGQHCDKCCSLCSQELMAGGHKRQIARSFVEVAMVSQERLAILATMADGPCELVQEQTSRGQAPAKVLDEGAVKEVKAKTRTLWYELERNLGRTDPENHDAGVACSAPSSDNKLALHCVDGRTLFRRRTGNSFRRVVAPFVQRLATTRVGLAPRGAKASSHRYAQ